MSEMLGNRYLLALRIEDAIPHFECRLQRQPSDWRAAHKLAVCHALAGHPDVAAHWAHHALAGHLSPDLEDGRDDVLWNELLEVIKAHSHELGLVRSALGVALANVIREPGLALHELTRAIAHTPSSEPMRQLRREIEAQLEVDHGNTK